MATILITDRDSSERKKIKEYLSLSGHVVLERETAEETEEVCRSTAIDLAIISVQNNDVSLLHLIKGIKARCSCPVIVMSSSDLESILILSYELGCDDYVKKPFSYREFCLRCSRILARRAEGRRNSRILLYANGKVKIALNKELRIASINDEKLHLTSTEYRVLLFLCEHCGETLSRETILKTCFDPNEGTSERIVDSHIRNIRAKTEEYCPDLIMTVRNSGYKFQAKLIS